MFARQLVAGGYVEEEYLEVELALMIDLSLGNRTHTTGPVSSAKGVPVLFTSSAASGVLFLASVATTLLMLLVHEFADWVKSASRILPVPSWKSNLLSPSPNATIDTDESLKIP